MKITMNNSWCYISEANFIPNVIKSTLQYEFYDEEKKQKIIKSLYIESEQKFPAGSWYSVQRSLDRMRIFYEFVDTTVYPTENDEIENSIHLRDYQEDAQRAFMEGKNEFSARFRMICSISTGGGKTVLASKLIARLNLPTIFFVHTKDLLIQTKRVLGEFFGYDRVGSCGGGEDDYKTPDGGYKQIVIAMIQAFYWHGRKAGFLVKPQYLELLNRSKFMIADECHHSSSDSWFWVAQACPAPFRLGLSATPWRADGRDLLLQAATGPVCHKISSHELIERGWLSKPNIKVYLVQSVMDSSFEETTWHNVYKAGIVFNIHRNAIISVAAVKAAMDNKSVLIIINHKIHGILLMNLINQIFLSYKKEGKINPSDNTMTAMIMNSEFDIVSRRACINLFRMGQLKILIGTSLYDEGVDLPSVNKVIMAAGGKSETKVIQRLGRSLRLGDRCLFITPNNNCTLFTEDDRHPFKCIELQKKLDQFDPKKAASHAFFVMNDMIGNVKHWDAETKTIEGKRPLWTVNSKEIQHIWNMLTNENILTNSSIDLVSPGFCERLTALSIKCRPNLDKGEVGPEEIRMFRLSAMAFGIDETISVKCPHRKVKNEVEYMDFFDQCQEHLAEHSNQRLHTYELQEHDPKEGHIEEFIEEENYQNDIVYQTRNNFIGMAEMLKQWPDYFTTDSEDDKSIEY